MYHPKKYFLLCFVEKYFRVICLVCLSMISNHSQEAPGLASFCFLQVRVWAGDNPLDCDYCGRCPLCGAGLVQCGVRPRMVASIGGWRPQPLARPEARMRWVRSEWSKDGAKTKTGRLSPGQGEPGASGGGRGRPVGGEGALRGPSGHTGATEARGEEPVLAGTRDRMVVRPEENHPWWHGDMRQCWLLQTQIIMMNTR